ncbi:MAG: hypothetical protein WA734_00270 [Candidatus Acidiferrales bacterium]
MTENKAGHLNRNKIISGGYNATKADLVIAAHSLGIHGRAVHTSGSDDEGKRASGRYTAKVGTNDTLQMCAEAMIDYHWDKLNDRRHPLFGAMRMWRDGMSVSSQFKAVKDEFPRLPANSILKILWALPVGKDFWNQIRSGKRVF